MVYLMCIDIQIYMYMMTFYQTKKRKGMVAHAGDTWL